MVNEVEIRVNALVNELRSHINDLSIKCATLAGELAVCQSRNAELVSQIQTQEEANAPDRK